MIIHALLFIAGLFLLVKGADFFIDASARLAKKLGVSEFIIGITLTAIGTSVPELASSISASLEGYPDLILGNIIGSNIANIGLVIGVSALISNIRTNRKIFARDGYIMISSVILFFLFSLDNIISRGESASLIVIYLLYNMFLFKTDGKKNHNYSFHDFIHYVVDFGYISTIRSRLLRSAYKKDPVARTDEETTLVNTFNRGIFKDIMIVIVSGAAVILGAKYLVDESIWIATQLSIPPSLIGLSIIAIGTSLPELTVAIEASKNKHSKFVLGNVLGSNVANIFLIIGISGLISPIMVAENTVIYSIPIMLFFSLFLLYFIKNHWLINKRKGLFFIIVYLLFLIFSFFNEFR